jgi:hypothetical protein
VGFNYTNYIELTRFRRWDLGVSKKTEKLKKPRKPEKKLTKKTEP